MNNEIGDKKCDFIYGWSRFLGTSLLYCLDLNGDVLLILLIL